MIDIAPTETTVGPITAEIIEEISNLPNWEERYARQVDLEARMRTMGIDRHWAKIASARERGQESATRSVTRLLNGHILAVVDGIKGFLADCKAGKAGRKHTAFHYLKRIEPETAALIALRGVLDGVTKGEALTPLARRVSGFLEDELAYRELKKADATIYDILVEREKKVNGSDYRRQRVSMMHNLKARELSYDEWPAEASVQVGTKLIEIVQQTTGLVRKQLRNVGKKKSETFVEATAETMEWINQENHLSQTMAPMYLPTIIPPRPWISPFDGGYWSAKVRRLPLVKTYSRPYLEELAELEPTEVYDAVNAIQHTPWAVNQEVLEVVRTLWANGSTLGAIPSADPHPLPIKPFFLEEELPRELWTEAQVLQFKRWKHAATDTHAANAKLKSLRLQFARVMDIAALYEAEEEIYFPCQMDWRTRAYAVPLFLNPQGSDLSKGLLQFARGVAINDEGQAAWLAIHGCNLLGDDKASLEDRVQWVYDNEKEIIACATDPYDNRLWASVDDPWQALAFCFEWKAYREQGFGFVSTLSCQMDGSCNGLQNFSAALKDPIGGKAVNLLPGVKPEDIYQEVADLVMARVQADALGEDEELAAMARGWLKLGVTRKVCKRPVMTLAYGAKQFGFKKQVHVDTIKPIKYEMGDEFPWEGSGWKAAAYMGGLIWEYVAQVVVAARLAMDWFRSVAKIAAQQDLPVRWETPDGLVVQQAYPKLLTKKVRLTFNGARIMLNVAVGTDKHLLNRQKQEAGISPNWVHSMDGSHMRATVRRGWAEGIRSFSFIHDSYGTHAANGWLLSDYLREEFVKMYSVDVLEKFREDLLEQLPEGTELPDLPKPGTLDLEEILDSQYFFA